MDRILPFLPELSFAIGLLALAGILSMGVYFRRKKKALQSEIVGISDLREVVYALKTEVADLRSRHEESAQSGSALSDWSTGGSGIHLNRRGQVLRLHRRGDSISQIASVLGISSGEVALIVKVQQLRTEAPG